MPDWELVSRPYLKQFVSIEDEQNENSTKHKIARLVVTGKQYDKYGNPNFSKLKKMIEKFLATEYQKRTYEFILTPGGFLTFDFPESLQYELDIAKAEKQSVALLEKEANSIIVSFFESLNPATFNKLKETADYFTIGIDGFNPTNNQSIELVAIYDLNKEKVISWTGKFYPTEGQKRDLIKINDLDTHFVELNNQRVLPGSKNTVKMGIGVQQNREQEYSKNGNKNTVISINIINQGLHCIINKKQDCDGLKNKITYHYVSRDSQAS